MHCARQPPPLTNDACIQVVAPSGPVSKEITIESLSHFPLPTRFNNSIFQRNGFFAGSKKNRLSEFQNALDAPSVNALLCARGGFGVTTILDDIDFKSFVRTPKWIVGNSDITALLLHIWSTYQIKTIHGPMAERFSATTKDDQKDLLDLLTKTKDSRRCRLKTMRSGTAQGPLIGGNLTMTAHMLGSLRPDFAQGCILFLEDVTETPYRIERYLVQLARASVFSQVCGIVLGEFTNCRPGKDGVTTQEVLERNLSHLPIPVVQNYPAAHGNRNRPFIHGENTILDTNGQSATLHVSDRTT